jgi:phage terminase Nu1 subunit (DNA packaging protein)
MNQSEFAALHRVSRKTVTKWKERGWLVFAGDDVDVEASNARLKRYRPAGAEAVTQAAQGNSQGNKSAKSRKRVTPLATEVTIQEGESGAQAAVRLLVASGADMNIDEAKRVKENYLALREQLEYDRDAGLVVEVADVAKAVGEEYAKVRTKLLSIPSEHAPRIHRLKTVQEVQDVMHSIIVEALEELTRDGDGNTA